MHIDWSTSKPWAILVAVMLTLIAMFYVLQYRQAPTLGGAVAFVGISLWELPVLHHAQNDSLSIYVATHHDTFQVNWSASVAEPAVGIVPPLRRWRSPALAAVPVRQELRGIRLPRPVPVLFSWPDGGGRRVEMGASFTGRVDVFVGRGENPLFSYWVMNAAELLNLHEVLQVDCETGRLALLAGMRLSITSIVCPFD